MCSMNECDTRRSSGPFLPRLYLDLNVSFYQIVPCSPTLGGHHVPPSTTKGDRWQVIIFCAVRNNRPSAAQGCELPARNGRNGRNVAHLEVDIHEHTACAELLFSYKHNSIYIYMNTGSSVYIYTNRCYSYMYISICSCIVTVLKGVSPVLERSLFTIIIHCYRECDAVTIFSTYIYIYTHAHTVLHP